MFADSFQAAAEAAVQKNALLKKNPVGYVLLSMLAGMYIGFGVLLSFSVGSMLEGEPYAKEAMGLSFGVALSLVVIAGAELFTGNNLVAAVGVAAKKISFGAALQLWLVCYVGNLMGSFLLAVLYHFSALDSGATGAYMAAAAAAKMSAPPLALFARGILCNMLVCLAVWCGFRCKSESGKLIMVFWCLFAFVTTGFEHSVANMTLMSVALLAPSGQAVSIGGFAYNLLMVTLGNMVGGIVFVAMPYAVAAGKKSLE